MTDWVRLWHDMPTDPKWRVIARKSRQPLPCVIALFNLMMVNASGNAAERGSLCGWDDEDAAAALDMEPEEVAAIREAMQGKVLEGNRLTGWERRQPKREDGTAAQRKAAWKEREAEKRNAPERTGTLGNAPETDAETETDIESSNEDLSAEPTAKPLSKSEVVDAWRSRMVPQGFPDIAKLTGQRERMLTARLRDSPIEEWQRVMDALERSSFCQGQNDRNWWADFDFILQPKSRTRLLEGYYER